MKVLIVGGVAGGATTAARLRRRLEDAELILFEKGGYISFANCGLPYYIGGEITERDELFLQTPQSFKARFNVDVRINSEVTSIDPAKREVTVKPAGGEPYTERYDKLVLAPGASPIVPPVPGADLPGVFTLRNVPDTDRIKAFVDEKKPRRAVIVGCGFIGLEMAEALVNLGLDVTAVDAAPNVLANLDEDVACDVHAYLRSKGIELLLRAPVQGFEQKDGLLRVNLPDLALDCDLAILAIGVRPDTGIAKAAGLELDQKGYIAVNEYLQTSNPDIYAAGDAVAIRNRVTGGKSSIPLAGPANRQGRVIADNIAGTTGKSGTPYKGAVPSSIIKLFDMTAASTGLNERTAKAIGMKYGKVYTFSGSHAGYYPGAQNMAIKTLYDPDSGAILGAQLVGYKGVDKRADVMAAAVFGKMTADDLAEMDLCYSPPYSSAKDPVNVAGYVIQNAMSGQVKHFYWDEVDALPRDGSVTLLDVRTKGEYARGNITGFVNIPVDELRGRIAELPSGKPVYVHCHSGLRSYVAASMLQGRGFEVYNLSGGWRLYSAATAEKKFTPDADCTGKPYAGTDEALARAYFHKDGLSCSESTMRILQRKGLIDSDESLTKSMSGFGGGLHRGYACGAVAGAVAGIGSKLGRSARGASKEPMNTCTEEFLTEFEKRYGSLTCDGLLDEKLGEAEQHEVCTGYVAGAVEIASQILEAHKND